MMRFTIQELERKGFSDDRLYVSMERNMKCGIGLCGHCQLGRFFICKDGPVMTCAQMSGSCWIREV
jgi:NAD(P)H-flavin reductase